MAVATARVATAYHVRGGRFSCRPFLLASFMRRAPFFFLLPVFLDWPRFPAEANRRHGWRGYDLERKELDLSARKP
ncbi:hypothetical protein Pyn_14247 [Prunus yedoensis var. nudiflora]|uniref:Uncharacterized protein n=1 Tax=Prunus yedoensis var. nudiflora TaxID=2094558 RepID=A0A314YCZ5_PRUYE|nr:hypothetical protein Pyn_14247 [Prunus yedoensis var. nudiflora]